MEQSRTVKSDESTSHDDINKLDKKSRAIRKDKRKYKHEKNIKVIENKRMMKIMKRNLINGRKEIVTLKDKNGNITWNKEHLLQIALSHFMIPGTRINPLRIQRNICREWFKIRVHKTFRNSLKTKLT